MSVVWRGVACERRLASVRPRCTPLRPPREQRRGPGEEWAEAVLRTEGNRASSDLNAERNVRSEAVEAGEGHIFI